jgi:hypothetical protein
MRKIADFQQSVRYEGKNWTVMTRNTETKYDDLVLPTFEKMVITIIRKTSESERKKYYKKTRELGVIKPSEWKKLA